MKEALPRQSLGRWGSLEGVRSQVEEIIGQGQQAPSGHIPLPPAPRSSRLGLAVKRCSSLTTSGPNTFAGGLIRGRVKAWPPGAGKLERRG